MVRFGKKMVNIVFECPLSLIFGAKPYKKFNENSLINILLIKIWVLSKHANMPMVLLLEIEEE